MGPRIDTSQVLLPIRCYVSIVQLTELLWCAVWSGGWVKQSNERGEDGKEVSVLPQESHVPSHAAHAKTLFSES